MNKIVPCLWFDGVAEQAVALYTSIFGNSRVGRINRYGREGQEIHAMPEGAVMTVDFEIDGYSLVGLNGGPHFRFSPANSFFVTLETEAEVDAVWAALVEYGTVLMPLQAYDWSGRYGWLNDRYGLSWQVMLGEREDMGRPIAPCLMFIGPQHARAEEALELYTSVFPDSRIQSIHRYQESDADPTGTIKHARFRLGGETFIVLESALAHDFGFTEAVSYTVRCDTQDEIDHYWNALSADPEAERCGWIKDRFGVSWQIVPTMLAELLQDPDPERSQRVMAALMSMKKLDIQALKQAYANPGTG